MWLGAGRGGHRGLLRTSAVVPFYARAPIDARSARIQPMSPTPSIQRVRSRDAAAREAGLEGPARRHRPGRDPRPRRRHRRPTRAREGLDRLTDLQDRLWAEQKHPVLDRPPGHRRGRQGRHGQARDERVQPDGLPRSRRSRSPTPIELAHDYLWRVHQRTSRARARSRSSTARTTRTSSSSGSTTSSRRRSGRGATTRSTRSSSCSPRAGTTIIKFFLWIDRDEQKERFQERLDDPTKRWKFRLGDLEERKLWDEYIAAYEDVLARCSTDDGAVVRHPGEPEVVPQPGGRRHPRRHPRRPEPARTRRRPRTSPASSSSSERPAQAGGARSPSLLSGVSACRTASRRRRGGGPGPAFDVMTRPAVRTPVGPSGRARGRRPAA